MKRYTVRKFRHPLFRLSPFYLDYGDGCFGTFKVPAQATKAIAFIKANPVLGV